MTGTEPQIQTDFSLTNYIECIRIDYLCEEGQNQFAIYKFQNITLQKLFASINAYKDTHIVMSVLPSTNKFILIQEDFSLIPTRNTTYIALKLGITCNDLETRLYNICRKEFAIQMPSRGKTFRN